MQTLWETFPKCLKKKRKENLNIPKFLSIVTHNCDFQNVNLFLKLNFSLTITNLIWEMLFHMYCNSWWQNYFVLIISLKLLTKNYS